MCLGYSIGCRCRLARARFSKSGGSCQGDAVRNVNRQEAE